MLPMPDYGPHLGILFTHLAAIGVATNLFAKNGKSNLELRRAATLMYFGVIGLGTFSYFVGRSHPWVLMSQYSMWGFSTVLLLAHCLLPLNGSLRLSYLRLAPLFILVGNVVLFYEKFEDAPSPLGQIERLNSIDESFQIAIRSLSKTIERESKGERNTAVIYPYGHWISNLIHKNNVFRFSHPGSIILKKQLTEVMNSIDSKKIKTVFISDFSPELDNALIASGFKLANRLTGGAIKELEIEMGDLKVFKR